MNNTNSSDPPIDESDKILFICLVSTLILVGLSGSISVLITIFRSRQIKLRQQGFVVSLVIADVTFLALIMPFAATAIAYDYSWPFSDALCTFTGYLASICIQASASNITLIAFNRYCSIVHFRHYKTLLTKHSMIFMFISTWIYAALISSPALYGWGRIHYHNPLDLCTFDWGYSPSFRAFWGTASFILPLILIAYFYAHILYTVIKSKMRLAKSNNKSRGENKMEDKSVPRIRREEIRLAIQLLLILAWFMICWSPVLTLVMIVDPFGELDRTFYDVTANLLVLNSVVNPYVYFFSNKTLRKEAKAVLCCCRRNTNQVQIVTSTEQSLTNN